MNAALTSVVLAGALAVATPALAINEMVLLNPDDLSNLVVVDITGDENRLFIDQTAPGPGAGNSVRITIHGNRNGGPVGSSFSGAAALSGLSPGQITQTGLGNDIALDVQGDSNLFAVAQIGNDNSVQGKIVGTANQVAVVQVGHQNFASFSQNGVGNIINIRQTSW